MKTNDFTRAIQTLFNTLYERIQTIRIRFLKEIAIGFGVVFFMGIMFVGYRWYSVYREREAQKTLGSNIQDLQKQSGDALVNLDELFQLGYTKHSNTSLAPYFLALQAEALIKQEQYDEARAVMKQMMDILSAASPLAPLFKLKYALMRLDSADEAMQKEGLDDLTKLAQDNDNMYNDIALFYLGRYYWAQDKRDEAKNVWISLIEQHGVGAQPSPWAEQARVKVQQLT